MTVTEGTTNYDNDTELFTVGPDSVLYFDSDLDETVVYDGDTITVTAPHFAGYKVSEWYLCPVITGWSSGEISYELYNLQGAKS